MNHLPVLKLKYLFLLFLLLFLFPVHAFADLSMHFLDVGQGDCTIIQCDGEAMIIDGGPPKSSSTVYTYLKELGIDHLKYAVATHPDQDHIGGLPGAFQISTVDVLLTPVLDDETDRFQTLKGQAEKHGIPIKIPDVGDVYALGSATLEVLSPGKQYASDNNMSIVLRLDYGNISVLFCGDAESAVEKDLLENDANLAADVLKVAHHGSKNATSAAFVEAVHPEYAVISHSDRYNHPDEDPMNTLLNAGVQVFTTYQSGNIVIVSDGVSIDTSVNAPYVGNRNSHKFHRSSCSSAGAMKVTNRVPLYTREEAIFKGYDPCQNCEP